MCQELGGLSPLLNNFLRETLWTRVWTHNLKLQRAYQQRHKEENQDINDLNKGKAIYKNEIQQPQSKPSFLVREERWQTFGADEAPADVDVTVVTVALLGVEVVGADDGGVGDHLTACSYTQVTDVVRDGAAQTTHQPTYSTESELDTRLDRFMSLRGASDQKSPL